MDDAAPAGIDMAAVTKQLEDEGVAAFATSYDALLTAVEGRRAHLEEAVAAQRGHPDQWRRPR